jgi:hypothetical protein
MAFSPQQHTSLLRDGLDFVPESDFRYLPINVRLKLVELEKTNGQVYLPKNEAASLKREVAAEKMSEVAKRNDPDAYFGGDPEYSSTPITDDPAELKGRLGTDEYGTRPTIYRAIEPEGAVFNNRYLTSGQYESQYKESDPTIYGRYTPTKKGDEILLPPTASWLNPFADRINETEPHEYMHRGMMPTNWLSKYLLGPIDSISEKVGVGNLFGTRVFAGNQHTYIAKALAEDKQKKQMADFERQTSKLSERELAILKKYLESERNKLQLEKNRINKANGDEAKSLSESEEYKRRLKKLENFISKNRLVSKEAQMSAMSEGSYKDPRFLNTTGHPLIDQYGMHPFPAEGSGQILSTTDLGMEGPESMFGRSLYGQYNPKEDTIIYKDLDKNIEGHKDYTSKEDTQKHELVHRTVRRSGWLDNFYNSPYLNDNAKLISGNKGKTLSPLINEALAHSYETLDKEELKKQIRFRASKFNLKEPDKIADEIFNNIEYLKNDFENHLEEINPNLTKYTRIKKATGGEANNLQAAIDLLNNPVTSSISPLGDPTLSPLMESLQKNPIDDFAMMMASPVKKVTSAARLAQLANPTNEVFKTATKKEIVDYIQTIPLKERLALRANNSIPLKGKYAILDSDKIDFYKDIVDLGKLPKNFKAGDNTLAKIYMEKNNIPSRVDITEPLAGFKPRPYFEEIIDFKKGTEKIKLSFPKTGVLQPYGAQTAYRTKTLTNPSKEQLDKLFKGMREKDLQKQLDGLRKAKSIENDPGSTLGDLAEATKLKQNASFKTSDDIAKELLELQGEGLLDTDLLAILRKQYNL